MALGWADFLVIPVRQSTVGRYYEVFTRLLFRPKYDGKALCEAIDREMKGLTLGETVTRLFVPAYDVKTRTNVYFDSCGPSRSTTSVKHPSTISLTDICAGTTAAPVYFPAHGFTHKDRVYNLVDRGVTTNNPTLEAIWIISKEMQKTGDDFNHDFHANPENTNIQFDIKKYLVLSLGTGYAKEEYTVEECREWGLVGWLYTRGKNPLIDIFSRASTMSVHWNTWFVFHAKKLEHRYLRINLEEVRHTYILVSMGNPEA